MANTAIVRHVTEALIEILRHDLAITVPSLPSGNIKAAPPEGIDGVTVETLIVYMYQVIESPFLKNVGPAVTGTPPNLQTVRDPLALDLYFLLIPGAPVSMYLDTYDILGAAMRSLHDHGTFTLGDWVPTVPVDERKLTFRLAFNRLETSDLIRIWEAVQHPYRLSVAYVVRTVQIDSQLVTDTSLVSQRNIIASTQ